MAYTDINNITFNSFDTNSFKKVKKVSNTKYSGASVNDLSDIESENDGKLPTMVNALEIDWNGALVEENVTINSTGDLLSWIKNGAVAGDDGGHWEFAYKNTEDATNAPNPPSAGTTTANLTGGWYATPLTLQEGYYTWMTLCFVSGVGQYGTWKTPIRLTGEDGVDGADGKSIEFIYTRNNTGIAPTAPSTNQADDYVPTGWTDNPQGVASNMLWEYVCQRMKINDTWGPFLPSTAAVWSKWGEKGMDGDGYEYIFKAFPTILTFSNNNNNPAYWAVNLTDDYLGPSGYQWSDNHVELNGSNGRYEYVSTRKKIDGVWGKFNTPKLWTNYNDTPGPEGPQGQAAMKLDLDNEHEDFLYNDVGVNVSGDVTTQAYLYEGDTRITNGISWAVSYDGGNSFTGDNDTFVNGSVARVKINSDGLVTISDIYVLAAKVKVRAYYNETYYYTEFTGNKITLDKYELNVNPKAIAFNPATFTDTRITATVTRTDLTGTKTNVTLGSTVNGVTIKLYATYIARPALNNTSSVTISIDSYLNGLYGFVVLKTSTGTGYVDAELTNEIYFELRKYTSSNTYTVVDYETVPIVKAENGSAPVKNVDYFDGEDGYTVTLNPGALILTLDKTTKAIDVSPIATVIVMKSGSIVNVTNITTSNKVHCKSTQWTDTDESQNSVGVVKVTEVNKDSNDKYYETGSFVATVTADGKTFNVTVPWYCNLIGYWNEEIQDGIKTTLAAEKIYELDSNGDVKKTGHLYQRVQSAESDISNLVSTVNGYNTTISNLNTLVTNATASVSGMETSVNGMATSVSSLELTSEKIGLNVDGANLLPNSTFEQASGGTSDEYVPAQWVGSSTGKALKAIPLVAGGHRFRFDSDDTGNFLQTKIWGNTVSDQILVPGYWHTLVFYALVKNTLRFTIYNLSNYIDDEIFVNGESKTLTTLYGTRKYYDISTENASGYYRYVILFFVKPTISTATSEGKICFSVDTTNSYLAKPMLFKNLSTGIDVRLGEIDMVADKFKLKDNSNNTLLGVENGDLTLRGKIYATDGEFTGTIRSANTYHSICYFVDGGLHFDENEERWAFCLSIDSTIDTYGFEVGKYYSLQQVYEISEHTTNGFPNGMIPCSYKADIIYMIPDQFNWEGGTNSEKTVKLPRPEDFLGKIVEIVPFSKTSDVKTVYVDCVRSAAMVPTAYPYYDATASGGKIQLSINSSGPCTVSTGNRILFLSIKSSNQYYWINVSTTNYAPVITKQTIRDWGFVENNNN